MNAPTTTTATAAVTAAPGLELVLTVGIPGAGKSTLATARTGYERVSRDALRTELFGPAYHDGAPVPECEADVTRAQLARVRDALAAGRSVIIDDTNIDPTVRELWAWEALAYGATFRLWVIDTPLETALARNAARQRRVPPLVIVGMWMSAAAEGLLTA